MTTKILVVAKPGAICSVEDKEYWAQRTHRVRTITELHEAEIVKGEELVFKRLTRGGACIVNTGTRQVKVRLVGPEPHHTKFHFVLSPYDTIGIGCDVGGKAFVRQR